MSFDVVIKRASETRDLAPRLSRCMITIATLIAISISSVKAPAATYGSGVGAISVDGLVRVNGEIARSGETIFAPSSIETSAQSESVIDFKNLVHFHLGPGSSLTIDGSAAQVSAVLPVGHLRCLVPKGTTFSITTTDWTIRIAGQETTVFDIEATECDGASVTMAEGQLQVNGPTGERVLMAGDTLTTGSASPPAIHAKKRIGIFILGGMAAGLLVTAIVGKQPDQEITVPGGCIDLLSGESNCR